MTTNTKTSQQAGRKLTNSEGHAAIDAYRAKAAAGTHTPTPWFIHPNGTAITRGPAAELLASCYTIPFPNDCPAEANAAFIVRCCNSHAALVAALECLTRWTDENVTDPAATIPINQAKAALKSAKESQP